MGMDFLLDIIVDLDTRDCGYDLGFMELLITRVI